MIIDLLIIMYELLFTSEWYNRMIIFSKLKNTKNETIMAYFEVLSWNLPVEAEENHENPQSGYLVFQ